MAAACLRRYQVIVIDGIQLMLHSRVGDEWQVKNPKDGRITSIPLSTIRRKYEDGTLQFMIKNRLSSDIAKELYAAQPRGKPEDVCQEAWNLAGAKLRLVKEVWAMGWCSKLQGDRIRELWPKLTQKLQVAPQVPDSTTVYRWWRKLEEYGWDVRALLPRHHMAGRKGNILEGVLLNLVEDAIEEEYLTQLRQPREEAFKAACALVAAWNGSNPKDDPLPLPTARQVYRHIKSIPAFDIHAARYGHDNAIRKFRGVRGSTVATRPLERVELDHTVLDLIVLDDQTLIPLGRPTICVAIDVFTRCILGIYVGFEPPSVSTVGQCIRTAMVPKLKILEPVTGLANAWEMYGLMETLVLDQALENHANAIDHMAGCLGIEVAWCGRKSPWQKGTIERFMLTLNRGFCHRIEGTTRSNIRDKDDYDALGRAVCTFSAVKNGLISWIVDTYHCKEHRSLQMAPRGKWAMSISEDDIPLATDLQSIDTLMRVPKVKPLTHKGIDCNSGQLYNSDELIGLRRRHGAELQVTIYPSLSNIGSIIVEYEPERLRFEVPALNRDYAEGMTIWQHKAIRNFAKKQGVGVASFEEQLTAKHSLASHIYEGMAESPLKTRVREARLLQGMHSEMAQAYSQGVDNTGGEEAEEDSKQADSFEDEFSGVEVETH